jgi:hypothetical protein
MTPDQLARGRARVDEAHGPGMRLAGKRDAYDEIVALLEDRLVAATILARQANPPSVYLNGRLMGLMIAQSAIRTTRP